MDFISKYHLITQMIQYDENLLNIIAQEKAKIEEVKQELETSRQNLKEYKTEH